MKKTIVQKVMMFVLAVAMLFATPMTAYAAGATTPTGIPISEIGSRIDEIVAAYMHEFTPGLAVAIVHNGEIVFMQGYGYADIERRMSVDPETTAFSFASISKLFVYVSLMQLVEQGLLDLDNDIHNYLPEDLARQFNFRYSFTMRDLLNHSAGFAENNFNEAWSVEDNPSEISLRDGLILSQPVQIYQPGTATAYSNWGSALAAYVVSYVTGVSFSDYLQYNVLNPLGMVSTLSQPHWFENTAFGQNVARGYVLDGDGNFNETIWVYSTTYPSGNMLGSVADLAQFAIALMPQHDESSPLFENRSTLDLLLSPSYTAPLRGTHHGFMTYDAVLPAVGHSGGHPGFNTDFVIVTSEGFGIIVLTNAQGGLSIIEKLLDLVLGNTMGDVSAVNGLPDARGVEGTFVLLRRNAGNIIEPANSMLGTHIAVSAIDENIITLTRGLPPIPGITGEDSIITYRQVAPNLFRAIDANSVMAHYMARTMYEIYFIMENGQPIGISMRGPIDATIMTFSQSMTALVLGQIATYGGTLFFLIASIIVLIRLLRKKGTNTAFRHLSNGLLLCGLLFGINLIIADMRMIAGMAGGLHFYMFASHIWINYILLAVTVLLFATSMVFFVRDKTSAKRKILYFASIASLGVFLFALWQWNFFVMM